MYFNLQKKLVVVHVHWAVLRLVGERPQTVLVPMLFLGDAKNRDLIVRCDDVLSVVRADERDAVVAILLSPHAQRL